MTKQKTKTTLKKDLTDVKIADKKKQILNIIEKWCIKIRTQKEEFRTEFLSKKQNKYFDDIKKIIGDFKNIPKMSVLRFLAEVIIGETSKYKVCRDLHKDFIKIRAKIRKEFKE